MDVEKLGPLRCCVWESKMAQLLRKAVWWLLKKIKHGITI